MIISDKEMHGYKIQIFHDEKEVKFPQIETINEDIQKVDMAIKEVPKEKKKFWRWFKK